VEFDNITPPEKYRSIHWFFCSSADSIIQLDKAFTQSQFWMAREDW